MFSIAVAGKGGTGKTTLSALIIRNFLESNKRPILAVDADPNSNLNEALGLEIDRTLVSIVDKIMEKKEDIPAGVTKERLLEYHLQDALIESKGFDLLVMGHTEGAGCYCSANNLLKDFMEKLRENYRYLVMDNEAGMEHLSRRTTRNVDTLLIVANPTLVSLKSAQRIYEMTQKLKLKIKKAYLVLIENQPDSKLEEEIDTAGNNVIRLLEKHKEKEPFTRERLLVSFVRVTTTTVLLIKDVLANSRAMSFGFDEELYENYKSALSDARKIKYTESDIKNALKHDQKHVLDNAYLTYLGLNNSWITFKMFQIKWYKYLQDLSRIEVPEIVKVNANKVLKEMLKLRSGHDEKQIRKIIKLSQNSYYEVVKYFCGKLK